MSELSAVPRRKLHRRQTDAAVDPGNADALEPPQLDARRDLVERVPEIARGNPGLQDLIGMKVVLSAQIPHDVARRTLDEMQAWLDGGDLPHEAQVRAFLKNLAIDTLHEQAGDAGRALLRALSVFDVPVPAAVAQNRGQRRRW